jgi:hypothetical protein
MCVLSGPGFTRSRVYRLPAWIVLNPVAIRVIIRVRW